MLRARRWVSLAGLRSRARRSGRRGGCTAGQEVRRPRPHGDPAASDTHSSTAAGVDGDQGGRQGRRLQGHRGRAIGRRVHRGEPRELPDGRVPEHVGRRAQRQRAVGVRALLQAGRRLRGDPRGAGHRAELAVHERACSARAPRPAPPDRSPGSRCRRRPRSRSPTACTTRASRSPSASTVTDSFYNTTSEVRGLQHVLATVDEDTYEEQDATPTRSDDHPMMWCQDLEGGRAFYTGVGHNAATFANANVRPEPRGRHQVGGRPVGPDVQRLRRDRARELQAGQDLGAAEPQRADRLRPAPRRAHHPDRARRAGPPARPRGRHHHGARERRPVPAGPVHAQRGRSLRPGRGRQLRAEQVGVPLLLAGGREGRPAVGRHDADVPDPDGVAGEPTSIPRARPGGLSDHGAAHRREHGRMGSVRRVLPALALQVRRGRAR